MASTTYRHRNEEKITANYPPGPKKKAIRKRNVYRIFGAVHIANFFIVYIVNYLVAHGPKAA